jgi:flagellar biosynthesis protein FliQ
VNLTVTLIGKISIVFLCGVTALIGISFVSSGGISIFSSIYRLVGITDTMVILYFVSQLVFSVGLTLIGVWITIKMIGYIKQTIQEIDQLFNQKKGV